MQALESHNFLPFLGERRVNVIFSHQGPKVPGIITRQVYFHWSILFFFWPHKVHSTHCSRIGLFPTLLSLFLFLFFFSPHRSVSHTFFMSRKVYFTNCRHIGLFHLFFFFVREGESFAYLTCHTGLFCHGLFATWDHCMHVVTTQVYFLF